MTDQQAIQQVLDFIVEIEKLKAVLRKTRPVGLERYENAAEHSWQVCLAALMLREYANEPVDIDQVIKMLLIHDLGEIDAGDRIVYAEQNEAHIKEEAEGIRRVLGLLPGDMAKKTLALWEEYEAGESAESRYARAIDRIPPLLHNLHGDGHSWKENDIAKEKVFSLNARIAEGSHDLWEEMKGRLEIAVSQGLLK